MAEQRNIHTRGIIIKKHPLGENDCSVTLYSPDLGKIQAAAKGARKMNGSLAGHIETLNLCEFQLYKSPVRYTIVQCQVRENFKSIRENFDRAMMAGLIMEIFHKSTHSSEHAPELYRLLEQSLFKLGSSDQHFLTVESFKLNLLQQIGVLPNLEGCGECHRRWDGGHDIWLEPNGHMICDECRYPHRTPDSATANLPNEGRRIEFSIFKLIRYLSQPPELQKHKISFSRDQKKQLEYITRFFLQHFLDREIVSERILQDLV